MTRVLNIGKYFPPPFGGIESVCVSTLMCMEYECVDIDLLVSAKGSKYSTIRQGRFNIFQIPTYGVLASQPLTFSMFLWLARSIGRYDVIHLHLPNPLACAAVLSAFRFARLSCAKCPRLVVTWHADIVRQKQIEILVRPLVREVLRQAVYVAAATPRHFEASAWLRGIPDNKRVIVPFFVESAYSAPNDDNVQAWRSEYVGKCLIVSCGRHVRYKGFEYLVKAAALLPSHYCVAIAGDGPLSAEYAETIRKLNLEARVRLVGALPRASLVGLLNAADIFCLPSVSQAEAFGVAMAEAMSCGKPVICCELGNGVNHLNLDGVTGYSVPPKNPAAIAREILALSLNPDLMRSLGEAGRERVTTHYSRVAMSTALMRLYDTDSDQGEFTD
jgi:glycosyltransferase involved in cell wall biosynthesis